MYVPVTGYAPDYEGTTPGVFVSCNQVVPTVRGMAGAPAPKLTALSALSKTVKGAATLRKQDDTHRFFAGMASSISEGGATSWTDVTRASGGGIREYNLSSDVRWRFAQFGAFSLAAAAGQTLQASTSGAFADVMDGGTTAPAGAVIEVVNQFVFLFDYNNVNDGWICSALGDHTDWVASIATQSASGRLYSAPGKIRGARKFGDSIIAYKQRSMFLGVYQGPPVIWNWTQIPGDAGALSHEAIVSIGTADEPVHIFMGYDDFYIYDGSRPRSIGAPLKELVFTDLNRDYQYMTTAVHDRRNSRVYWFYPSSASVNPDRAVVYNYRSNRWGRDDRQITATCEYLPAGVAYNDLGSSYANYDSLPSGSYDEAFASSGEPLPAIFDSTNTLRTLNGDTVTSSFRTNWVGDDDKWSLLQRITPRFVTQPTSAEARISYRYVLGDAPAQAPGETIFVTAPLSSGRLDVLSEARWHQLTLSLTGNWEMEGLNWHMSETVADE